MVVETPDGPRATLARAADADKDQTYFLYGLRQDQLWHSRFPLGDLTKPEVRAIARGLGLVTADKPESQEICFVPGGDYRDELRSRGGWTPERGPDPRRRRERAWGSTPARPGSPSASGRASASRSASRATCPGSTRPPTRSCSAGARTSRRALIELEGGTFVAGEPPAGRDDGRRLARRSGPQVRIRHRAPLVDATVRPASPDEPARGGRWIVETDTPVWAIAPGQACVLYDGDRVPRRRAASRRPWPPRRRRRPPRPSSPGRRMTIPPALPLALLLGLLHTSHLRPDPRRRRRPAAADVRRRGLGAWAGAALGGRIGLDLLAIGDFPLIPASIMAWVGIGIVAILATLGPQAQKAR